jgi:hypothetical protein
MLVCAQAQDRHAKWVMSLLEFHFQPKRRKFKIFFESPFFFVDIEHGTWNLKRERTTHQWQPEKAEEMGEESGHECATRLPTAYGGRVLRRVLVRCLRQRAALLPSSRERAQAAALRAGRG